MMAREHGRSWIQMLKISMQPNHPLSSREKWLVWAIFLMVCYVVFVFFQTDSSGSSKVTDTRWTEPVHADLFQVNVDTIYAMITLFCAKMGIAPSTGGYLAQRPEELKIWAAVAHHERITTPNPFVCEIGFGIGFSALTILSQHPTATYIGFDLGWGENPRPTAAELQVLYPDRFRIFWGDSSTNILQLAEDPDNDIRCDIWIIDAAHDFVGAQKDIDVVHCRPIDHRLSQQLGDLGRCPDRSCCGQEDASRVRGGSCK